MEKSYFNIVLRYETELMSFNTVEEANAFLLKNPDPDEAYAESEDCKQVAEFDA